MKDQWFFEAELPGEKLNTKTGIKIKKKLFSGKTLFQKIEVFNTYEFGRMLTLNDMIQVTEKDEFIYHEMLVHPAMFYHFNPKKVLIVGGGDGGTLREVLKHSVEEVHLVEIDERVIEVSQKYLPFIPKGAFENKKVKIFIEDGIKFIKKYHDFFDLVILDSTDSLSPSVGLFSESFYRDTFKSLSKNGILSIQTGCFFEPPLHLNSILKKLRKIFSFIKIHKAYIPSFQTHEHSFTVASKFELEKISLKKIEKKDRKLNLNLKYYCPGVHFASAILPRYIEEKLK